MAEYLLAHDLGTSGNKAVLYREDGALAASSLYEYETYYPFSGAVEQDPERWWEAVCRSTKKLLDEAGVAGSEIAAVSFSGQMMGCLLLDRSGKPLRNMLIWADTRAGSEEAFMKSRMDEGRAYRITGHRISASYSAAKALWVKEHEPALYGKCWKMIHAKDYIIYKLTGNLVSDYSDASGTNLFDLEKKVWSKELLEAYEIPEALLPEVHPSTDIAGYVTAEAARLTGLTEGTPVVTGGGDGSCACVGAGVVREGSAYNVLGSSSWISTASGSPMYDEEMRTFNWVHLDPKLYTPCGTMQAAGYSYSWYKNTLCGEEREAAKSLGLSAYEVINRQAAESRPGAGGLLYLPYLLGERSPRWNAEARGSLIGLSVTTSKGDISRAILEGVGYNLKVILDILQKKQEIAELILIGGGAKGRLWLQILADIWQKRILVPAYLEEATSMGAAVCAGVGIGMYPDFSVMEKFNRIESVIEPNAENAGLYDEMYGIFNASYEALCDVYGRLGEYRKKEDRAHQSAREEGNVQEELRQEGADA